MLGDLRLRYVAPVLRLPVIGFQLTRKEWWILLSDGSTEPRLTSLFFIVGYTPRRELFHFIYIYYRLFIRLGQEVFDVSVCLCELVIAD